MRRTPAGVHGPAHLDARIDAFLEAFSQRLAAYSDEEFDTLRSALIAAKLQKDTAIAHEGAFE